MRSSQAFQSPLFILSQPRTGSELLREYLNQLPGVFVDTEVLNRFWDRAVTGRSREDALIDLDRCIGSPWGEVRGAKLHLEHLEDWGVDFSQLDQRYPHHLPVVVYRRSLLDQYVSLQVALRTDQWTSEMAASTSPETVILRIDKNQLREYCDMVSKRYIATANYYRSRAAWVCYEDLVYNAQATLATTVGPLVQRSFSGLLPPRISKQATRALPDVVEDLHYSVPDRSSPWLHFEPS